jgi:hypothetical protein
MIGPQDNQPISRAPVYVLRLRPVRRDNAGDIGRLRAILKILLRNYGMRCLSVEEEAQP